MDSNFWKQYGEEAGGDFESWTCSPEAARVFHLHHIRSEPGGGISQLPGTIRSGGNSGFMAVGLALHFGAARVTMLGYDMQDTNGRIHFHRDHPEHIGNPIRSRFKAWRKCFAEMAKETDVPIVNATRQTALECFSRMSLAEALA
jgi:hypothetical protein